VVLPLDFEQLSQTAKMKVVELSGVTTVDCPSFAGIKKRRHDHRIIANFVVGDKELCGIVVTKSGDRLTSELHARHLFLF
jgi:hypothetical protein